MAKKRVVLTFPPSISGKPVTYRLVKDYDLSINILRAQINPREEGKMVLEVQNSSEEQIEAGLAFLANQGITVERVAQEISFNEEECIDCGSCTAVCRPQALSLDPTTWKLVFDREKCIMCEMCVPACPVGVIKVSF